jgi:hypothetical protein
MTATRAELAARNNAIWCDTVCRGHGVPGEFFDAVWVNRRPVPSFYPNLVTLRDAGDPTLVLEHLRGLAGLSLRGGWAVKDSFCTLDLGALGFAPLFDAQWIWHGSVQRNRQTPLSGIHWKQVTSAEELAIWETAWSAGAGVAATADRPRQFPPSLLADRDVLIFAGWRELRLVAGGIANHADGVVGLSNVFAPAGAGVSVWEGLVGNTQSAFPGLPLAGYQQGPGLEAAHACGFETVGTLRVWLST